MKILKSRNLIYFSFLFVFSLPFLLSSTSANQPDGRIQIKNVDCFPLTGSSPRVKFNIQSHQEGTGCDATPSSVEIVKKADATVNVKGTGSFFGRSLGCSYLVNADWAPGVRVNPNSVVSCKTEMDLVCICHYESSL